MISDDPAKSTPATRAHRSVGENLRNAKPAPRSTIPSPASQNGIASVRINDANASGKPVHKKTSTKTNQTWLKASSPAAPSPKGGASVRRPSATGARPGWRGVPSFWR